MKLYDMPRIPLRLLLGVQILLFGAVSVFDGRTPASLVGATESAAYAWGFMILAAGACLLLSCVFDLVTLWAHGAGKEIGRVRVDRLGRFRVNGYFFAGAVWGGFGYLTMFDGVYTMVDVQTPVYMIFLAWVALEDAYRNREVQQGQERRFPHSVLHQHFSSGLPAARVRGRP